MTNKLLECVYRKFDELEALLGWLSWLTGMREADGPPCNLDDDSWLSAVVTQLGRFALARQLAAEYILDLERADNFASSLKTNVRLSQIDDRYEELLTYIGGAAQEIEEKKNHDQ